MDTYECIVQQCPAVHTSVTFVIYDPNNSLPSYCSKWWHGDAASVLPKSAMPYNDTNIAGDVGGGVDDLGGDSVAPNGERVKLA